MDGTPGPRDHLITQRLARDLSRLDPEMIVEEALDPAEGPTRLARHAMQEIERELSANESAEDQTARLNRVLRQFGSDEAGSEAAQVGLPPRVLLGIRRAHRSAIRCLCHRRRRRRSAKATSSSMPKGSPTSGPS